MDERCYTVPLPEVLFPFVQFLLILFCSRTKGEKNLPFDISIQYVPYDQDLFSHVCGEIAILCMFHLNFSLNKIIKIFNG